MDPRSGAVVSRKGHRWPSLHLAMHAPSSCPSLPSFSLPSSFFYPPPPPHIHLELALNLRCCLPRRMYADASALPGPGGGSKIVPELLWFLCIQSMTQTAPPLAESVRYTVGWPPCGAPGFFPSWSPLWHLIVWSLVECHPLTRLWLVGWWAVGNWAA